MAAVTLDSEEIWQLLKCANDWALRHSDSPGYEEVVGVMDSVSIRTQLAEAKVLRILAGEIFGDRDKAASWLKTPNPWTDNVAPAEFAKRPGGLERVKVMLMRLDYGVLA